MTRMLLAAAAGFLCVVPPQQAPPAVFRSGVDGVTIQVSVRRGNQPVAGLTGADFALKDNGVLQEISTLLVEQLPVDLTLLLDLSSSVDGQMLQRLTAAVSDTAALLRPEDRIRLVTISQVLREVFSLRAADQPMPLDTLAAEGATSLYDGLTASMMRPSPPGRRQLIVAFTDGKDSTSIIDETTAYDIARMTDAVVDVVVPVGIDRAAGAPSSLNPTSVPMGRPMADLPVVVGPADRSIRAGSVSDGVPPVLVALVSPTAGQVFALDPWESVSRMFKHVIDDFRASYVLQYVPRGVSAPGWHDVSVSLKKKGKFDIRARKGYAGRE
jgi:VWFA-related protein